jgi:hypothetical protein
MRRVGRGIIKYVGIGYVVADRHLGGGRVHRESKSPGHVCEAGGFREDNEVMNDKSFLLFSVSAACLGVFV